jgi:uncharacterized membrane protein YeaQ/YmgE (transglycosylase-associated protein family)
MHWLYMAICGLIVGALAKWVMPGRDGGGIIATTLLGIAGSVVGGWLARLAGLHRYGLIAPLVVSVLGAVLLLAIFRAIARGQKSDGGDASA